MRGDAARLAGEVADYQQLQELLAPLTEVTPVYVALGNHDNRDNFFQVFGQNQSGKQGVTGKHVLVVEHPGFRLILLDSLLYVNQVAGLLGKAQRQWLASFLEGSDDRATVLFVHHTLGDGDGELLDVERLFRLIRPHPKVKAIFYGHSHVYGFGQQEGIHLVNLPALGYNFRDSDPVGWIDARFSAAGVELTLRAIGGNRADDGKTTSLTWER